MRTLIISDLHIGDPRYADQSHVLDLLRKEKYDRLVLNGDIIDMWLDKIKNIQKSAVIKELSNIAQNKEVIWVIGNHDYYARGKNVIPGATEVDTYHIEESGKKILCIHGHQVYEYQNMPWYSKLGTILNVWVWSTFGIDIQRWYNKGFMYSRYVCRKRQLIIDRFANDVDAVIIGHTHLFGCNMSGRSDLFDIGSTAVTRTYIVVEGGLVLPKII